MDGYRATLNLPHTGFPMKADLVSREPQLLSWWAEEKIYDQVRERRRNAPRYILHDGPPYANGHIHIGHALNKILKDIILKAKTMEGFAAPYVPGWDCHGLPIEHQVLKEIGPKKKGMSHTEIRRRCREYAEKFVGIQREEFKRLGVFGDWDHPYLTMAPDYEAAIVREFGKIVAGGGVYKGKKPVLWCPFDETALAEAEVEYADHTSPSIYVKFRVIHDPLGRIDSLQGQNPSFVIWTTTPWTLVANEAVCLHPEFDYQAVSVNQDGKSVETWIIAKELVARCMKEFGIREYSIVRTCKGKDLEHIVCRSPFVEYQTGDEWTSTVILGTHVRLDEGTGCVHTAPGHGQEDYEVGLQYGLRIFAPLDSRGRFTDEIDPRVNNLRGIEFHTANDWIIHRLSEIGTLVKRGALSHSYPYCWRCKNPVIFRATEQWFLSMEENRLRQRAINAIENDVRWIPKWGKERILGMMENRPDWCISRQRVWGVPIVAFICRECKRPLVSQEIADHVADRMEEEGGSDIWFSQSVYKLLPEGTTCPGCNGSQFQLESDILDVWFESGVSHAAVLLRRPDLCWPADLYLEGSDQHRGWFHSSLLASIGARGKGPYKMVLTHGFVVDGSGKKMSKSAGNVISPQEVIDRYGAEILRLWVAAENYREDIRISQEILSHLVEAYRKMRNTCRYLLGNLYDFDPERDSVPDSVLLEIDRWALHQLQTVIKRVRKAYAECEFHIVFHTLNNLCSVALSSFYLDILKDRLYTCKAASPERRAAQTVLYKILISLTQMMAPVLCFTAEEVWQAIPLQARKEKSVHLTLLPDVVERHIDEALASRWDRLIAVRDEVARSVEKARMSKMVGSSLEAAVFLFARGDLFTLLKGYEKDLPTLFIVSQVSLTEFSPLPQGVEVSQGGDLGVMVAHAEGRKCERCWTWSRSVGASSHYPTLCSRCADVVG